MELSAIALRGLNDAERRLDNTAARLARLPETSDAVELSNDMVSLIETRLAYETNLKVLETAGQMEEHVLDLLA